MYTILNGAFGNVFLNKKYYRRVSSVGTPSIDTETCLTRVSFWVFMSIWVHLLPELRVILSCLEALFILSRTCSRLAQHSFMHSLISLTVLPVDSPNQICSYFRLRSFQFGSSDISAVSSAPAGFIHFPLQCGYLHWALAQLLYTIS